MGVKLTGRGPFREKWGFYWKNGVFVGFWPRNRGKVGKSREFGHFWKIG